MWRKELKNIQLEIQLPFVVSFDSKMLHVAAHLAVGRVGPPPTGGLAAGPDWMYGDSGTTMPTDETQKATWEAFGEACVNGRSQSPINICTQSVQPLTNDNSSLQLHLRNEAMLPMNSGHNFELTVVDGQEKLYAEVEGEQLQFVQVHWHAPSENTVDGSYAAMEAHFVHQGCVRRPHSTSLSRHQPTGLVWAGPNPRRPRRCAAGAHGVTFGTTRS